MSETNPRYILPEVDTTDLLHELIRRMEKTADMLENGLSIDGEHHKQWYLWQIADTLKVPFDKDGLEEGIAP